MNLIRALLNEREKEVKYMIFTDDISHYEEYEGFHPEDLIYFIEDEITNLNSRLDNNLIAIGNIGLWNGRRLGYQILTDNLNSILTELKMQDTNTFYSDGKDVKAIMHHHDGTNYVTFRMLNNKEDQMRFLNRIYNNEDVVQEEIDEYTTSLHDYIADIYGWEKLNAA